MVIRIDPSKTPEANLYDLISKSNNGLVVGPDSITLGTPTILSTPVGNRDTEIPLTAVSNKGFSGTSKIRYNRLALNESVKTAPSGFQLAVTDTFDSLKAKIITAYGLIASEVVFNNGSDWALPSGSGASSILSMAPKPGSLMYNGSAINLTISRPGVSGSNTYDQFANYVDAYLGGSYNYPHVVIAAQNATAGGGKFRHGIIANQEMSGSPYRNWVSCDTPVSRVLQHLLPNREAEQVYFSNGWVFAFRWSAASARPSLPSTTRNGYTSKASATTIQAVQILELLYWDPTKRLGMRWVDPWKDGTEPVPINLTAGEAVFTTPGVVQWTVPENVFSVSVVTVGAGAATTRFGGAGGALGWKNNIPVTPGEVIEIQVGAPVVLDQTITRSQPDAGRLGDSYFKSRSLVSAMGATSHGGIYDASSRPSAGFIGDGGGNGGNLAVNDIYYYPGIGGGGAGGYAGYGGNGANSAGGPSAPKQYSGGGYGGGGGNDTAYGGGGGGGVGINGQGLDGTAGNGRTAGGNGGSNGQPGGSATAGAVQNANGGNYGGGAPGSGVPGAKPGVAGQGAVRVIWGDGRAFPQIKTGPDSSTTVTNY